MSRPFFIVNIILLILATPVTGFVADIIDEPAKEPVIITSQTLIADNKNNTATFAGSVIAKTGELTMYSDKMTVSYDDSAKTISKIHAIGNVKVNKGASALFSDEAVYFNAEEKIIFTGNPKVVQEGNVITGREIIFYLKDDRAVVEDSRVILQNRQGLQ